jgi:hypothetical protein
MEHASADIKSVIFAKNSSITLKNNEARKKKKQITAKTLI